MIGLFALLTARTVLVEEPAVGGPCDIFDAAGTPCVAAHSMVRALYKSYAGPLYLVQRYSDLASVAVTTKGPGGFADAAVQEAFCINTNCTVTRIFDQSPRSNHLGRAPWGGASKHAEHGVNASKHKLNVGGHPVYGALFEGGMGYRCDSTWGVATGNDPETMYMVAAGKHYNDGCCFDYGSARAPHPVPCPSRAMGATLAVCRVADAEIDALDHGKGTMEAVYWGNSHGWSRGAGAGPWVMADIENGLWAGNETVQKTNEPIDAEFVTAMVKGGSNGFALLGGDATEEGGLKTLYEGPRPPQYQPMKKQGAIILGIGGDSSDWAIGTFYEGVMAQGYASDETTKAVHANIVAAGYGK